MPNREIQMKLPKNQSRKNGFYVLLYCNMYDKIVSLSSPEPRLLECYAGRDTPDTFAMSDNERYLLASLRPNGLCGETLYAPS